MTQCTKLTGPVASTNRQCPAPGVEPRGRHMLCVEHAEEHDVVQARGARAFGRITSDASSW